MNDEYGIYFRDEVAAAHLRSTRRWLWIRIGSMLFSVGVSLLLVLIWPQVFEGWLWWMIGSSALFGGFNVVIAVIQFVRVSRDSRRVRPGLAIGLNRDGVLVAQQWLPWAEVGRMAVRPGTLGASSELVATARNNQTTKIPLDYTDALPATLDAAVRVLSAGRAWVDLSDFE